MVFFGGTFSSWGFNILCAVRSCVFKCRFELNFRLIALIITGENKCRTNEVEESAGEVQELNKRGTCTAVIKYMEQMKEVLSRPLKSTHLRDIARKQCPADFFNK